MEVKRLSLLLDGFQIASSTMDTLDGAAVRHYSPAMAFHKGVVGRFPRVPTNFDETRKAYGLGHGVDLVFFSPVAVAVLSARVTSCRQKPKRIDFAQG
jgi:hypothetical protein